MIENQRAASPVIFGEEDDAALLGTVSLKSLGLLLDPMKRVLRPLPMVLGRVRPIRRETYIRVNLTTQRSVVSLCD